MGDAKSISFGRKPLNNAGLEFAGARKSRFAQYTAQQHAAPMPPPKAVPPKAPASQQLPPQQPVYAPVESPYQEVPHDRVLYPQLSPIDTIEVPVLPDDTITNELAFDVGDTLDENDEFFADMPKSKIKRPGMDLKEEARSKRKKVAKRSFGAVGLVAGMAVLFVSWSLIQRYSPPVSAALRKKVGYPVYQIQPNTTFAVDRKSVEINENNSLVYKVKDTTKSSDFVFSQQQTPEVVKSDENYQDFLNQTDKFASLETPLGKAYLTKPQGIGTDVSVVLRSGTTLLFIRGPGDTSEQTWSELVSLLKLQ